MHRSAYVALAAVLALLVVPASASAYPGFKVPSGNIHCMGAERVVRCDIFRTTNGKLPRPASCDLDWGTAYATRAGWRKGKRLCVGDTVLDLKHRVLGYGTRWHYRGVTCTSRAVGLTCANVKGHGFFLSRGRQRLF